MLPTLCRPAAWALGLTLAGALPAHASAHEVSGQVRLVRPDGVIGSDSDGFVVLRTRQTPTSTAESTKISIEGGRYTTDLPEDCEFQVQVVRIDEGDCYPVAEGRWMPLPVSHVFDLDVRVLRSFALRVYGSDGRQELTDVTIVRKRRRDARLPHPDLASSKTDVVTGPSPSPVDIRVTSPEKYTYFAKAPGHAWGRIEVDPFLGGVATLQLEAGGELDVHLSQLGPERGKVFRVRRHRQNGRELYLELKRYDERELVDGLPVGTYTVTSEEPIRPDNMPVYGSTEAVVTAGVTTPIEVVIARDPTFSPAPVAGKLLIPEGWGDLEELTVVLKRIDRFGAKGRYYEVPGSELKPVAGRPRMFQWSIPEVLPGGFDITVRPLSIHSFREVHGGGNLRLDLELPEPREIVVSLVDEITGEPAPAPVLYWQGVAPEVGRSKIKDLPPIDSEQVPVETTGPGQFRFRAPQHPLILTLDVPEYERMEADLDAATIDPKAWKVRRATGLRLRLIRNGQLVDWKGDAAISPRSGPGQVIGSRRFGEFRQYDLSHAGPYLVELPDVPGYGRVPSRTVEIVQGEILEFDVRLDD